MNNRLQADQRWEVFYDVKTHEEFATKLVPHIFLHPSANEDIRGVFGSIQRQLVAND